jgi:hypothetical protein
VRPLTTVASVDDRYLDAGLAGLAHAGEPFMAHFGAALLAGWWLERDAHLSPETSRAVARQADAVIARHGWLFEARADDPSTPRDRESRADEIVAAIADGLDHTWAIGHDVIYAALVVRTLRQRPELGADWIVDGVLTVLKACRSQPLDIFGGVFDVRAARADEVDEAEVATASAVSELALRTVLQFDHVYLGLHQGDIGHVADHAHALLTLERLGHAEVARKGREGFREHVAAARRVTALCADLAEVLPSGPADPRRPEYWDDATEANDWAVGHVFKYPYAMLDLLDVAGDPALAAPVLTRLGQLVRATA